MCVVYIGSNIKTKIDIAPAILYFLGYIAWYCRHSFLHIEKPALEAASLFLCAVLSIDAFNDEYIPEYKQPNKKKPVEKRVLSSRKFVFIHYRIGFFFKNEFEWRDSFFRRWNSPLTCCSQKCVSLIFKFVCRDWNDVIKRSRSSSSSSTHVAP